YLAAGQYTIADMICYPWASSWANRKIDIEEFPNAKRWLEEMAERPAVKKAMAMGPEVREDPASISAEERDRRRKLVADQRAPPPASRRRPGRAGAPAGVAAVPRGLTASGGRPSAPPCPRKRGEGGACWS